MELPWCWGQLWARAPPAMYVLVVCMGMYPSPVLSRIDILRRLHSPRRRKFPHASLHMYAIVKLIANLLPPWHHAHLGAFQRSSNRARPSHARPAPVMSRPHSIPPCPNAHQTLASSSLRPLTAMPAANVYCMRLPYMYLARHVPLVACRAVSKLPFRPRE
jgi:hypothetical protein